MKRLLYLTCFLAFFSVSFAYQLVPRNVLVDLANNTKNSYMYVCNFILTPGYTEHDADLLSTQAGCPNLDKGALNKSAFVLAIDKKYPGTVIKIGKADYYVKDGFLKFTHDPQRKYVVNVTNKCIDLKDNVPG